MNSKTELFTEEPRVAVVIPSYRVTAHIIDVIQAIGPQVWRIYVIDDACPDGSGQHVLDTCTDPRVRVLPHDVNKGVGGAVMTGYREAIADNATIIVKIDGDGQMDPALIPFFIEPILAGEADYTKGNRFFNLEEVQSMPRVRLFGNAILSLMAKLSTGYWDLFDPTNGYTAIHRDVARLLPLDKVSERYFFETDILFRLNTVRAVVVDIPMQARYGEEISHLRISRIVGEFLFKHLRNFTKRVFYNYYLRDMSLASIELPVGILMVVFGTVFGGYHWYESAQSGVQTPAGTVMLSALPMLLGLQLIMAFLGYDIASVPSRPRHSRRRNATSLRKKTP
ncbi:MULTISPECIES: glycosyltransferase family 2 protein [Pseudomonas]|uniref:glycosyltransferase family 2 protein n=1 Tax=Pseudomonas TaxID=286 RepID=UPI001BEC4D95|nr:MULTISPECIES: glycosyltransferase family 2 protein [Pseudomonas]MBT2338998.1 glycosyltransferase family 2 protein [Pseudomonas fluorescens]MCD4527784.1 glycosyltransferase family 2 protein [Pseudomonas sp. C3-2018]